MRDIAKKLKSTVLIVLTLLSTLLNSHESIAQSFPKNEKAISLVPTVSAAGYTFDTLQTRTLIKLLSDRSYIKRENSLLRESILFSDSIINNQQKIIITKELQLNLQKQLNTKQANIIVLKDEDIELHKDRIRRLKKTVTFSYIAAASILFLLLAM